MPLACKKRPPLAKTAPRKGERLKLAESYTDRLHATIEKPSGDVAQLGLGQLARTGFVTQSEKKRDRLSGKKAMCSVTNIRRLRRQSRRARDKL